MIRTLQGNNGSYAGLGSVQIQPEPAGSVDYEAQAQTTKVQSDYSSGPIPLRQASLPVPVLLHGTGSIAQLRSPNLSDIASMVVDEPGFVFPLGSGDNNVLPTYNLALTPGKTYDPRQNLDHPTTTTKFTPFELLTGISRERPEVVMLTNFVPLFNKDQGVHSNQHAERLEAAGIREHETAAGRYLQAQFHLRSLHHAHLQTHVRSLRRRYPTVDQLVRARTDSFSEGMRRLRDDATFLLNAARVVEDDKKRLDLRNDAFLVKDPTGIARYISNNFTQLHLSLSPNQQTNLMEVLVQQGNRHAFDFRDCMHDLGYSQDSVNNVFSSSKIWLQTLYELKQLLTNHSLKLLDIDPTNQRRDTSPSNILRSPVRYFGIAPTLPALPPVSEIINLPVAQVSQAVSTLQAAYGSIYQNGYFKSEEARIAALSHLLSREYRYSYGLSLAPVQSALSRFYGFTVEPRGNSTLFDSVIGTFGNNISDFPAQQGNSLASVSQVRPSPGVGVLTFESKYVEGDTGTLTPGGDYYFDRIMSNVTAKGFDTSGCDQLLKLAEDQINQLLVIVDGFNLLMLPTRFDHRLPGTSVNSQENFLGHPSDVFFELATQLVNVSSGKVLAGVEHDRLGAVYARARTDPKIKTILFLYTMSKISRAYGKNVPFLGANPAADNTPLVDNLISRLVTALESSVPQTQATVQLVTQRGLDGGLNTAALTPDSITHALKSGTTVTKVIEQFMSSVIDWFRNRTSAINGSNTRFSGYDDTLIMMIAFDFAIAVLARYSDQQLVGVHRGMSGFSQGQVTFAVSQTATNHSPSIHEVIQRYNAESDLSRQLIVTLTNALLAVANMSRSASNYFNSAQARSKLTEVATGLGNDQRMLRMLLTEQQIMLLATTVESLLTARNRGGLPHAGSVLTQARSSYNSGGNAAAKEVDILDESDVPPEMEHALTGYFAGSDFASQSGINKRILTVGIPHGFTQLLKQKVSVQTQKRATFQEKKADIIQVTVYKVDMQHTDVVYRPVRYLFELSRFPTRFTTAQWLPLKSRPSLVDIINAIPTQCFALDSDSRLTPSVGIEYASTAVAGAAGVKSSKAAFADPAYSFMTAPQRSQVLHNHVVSQLLEVYIKLMTGVNVSEYTFHVQEPPPMADRAVLSTLVQHSLAQLAELVGLQNSAAFDPINAPHPGGVLFSSTAPRPATAETGTRAGKSQANPLMSNPAGTAGNVQTASQFRSTAQHGLPTKTLEQQSAVGSPNASLDALSAKHVAAATTALRTVSRLGNTLTPLTGADAYNYRVLCPKQFDRVFNVMVDARDFEIDVKRTLATPYGRQALDLMIKNGDVVPADSSNYLNQSGFKAWRPLLTEPTLEGRRPPQGRLQPNVNNFQLRDKDKSQGDLVADKYFVTIETLEESDDA